MVISLQVGKCAKSSIVWVPRERFDCDIRVAMTTFAVSHGFLLTSDNLTHGLHHAWQFRFALSHLLDGNWSNEVGEDCAGCRRCTAIGRHLSMPDDNWSTIFSKGKKKERSIKNIESIELEKNLKTWHPYTRYTSLGFQLQATQFVLRQGEVRWMRCGAT